MFRILFSMMVSVAFARWSYSELKLVFPAAVPYVDSALTSLEIPTHDKWSVPSEAVTSTENSKQFKRSVVAKREQCTSEAQQAILPASIKLSELTAMLGKAQQAFERF